ncbi:MAG: ABC transporter ATP-binding protein [Alphaproteobacteria bacterium 16-39-46]|nr:MAG: ABC transporter ATP-binding protein [Alphaproteobacteria bacterium 16-39-46]OZA44362.1 MAG: ABC transporter ATP-binding protein [Alphaproteobacteria bacterium 17-39-52]HQS83431.1 ABC transporter ATP-binding protein [Alphaproteobacteria bacterium]HQS93195.1 ABC transporter ATP-binding protein [Alphaproteobacteria bacterium]
MVNELHPSDKKFPKTLSSLMLYFLKPYTFLIWVGILCSMASGLYGVVNSNLLKLIIDSLERVPSSNNIASAVFWPALFFIINFEIHNLSWRGIGYINKKIQPYIKNKVIRETFSYVISHSHQFFQENLSGKISNNINILANNMEESIHDISPHIIRGAVLLIGALISMYFVRPIFFYGFAVWAFFFFLISWLFSKKIVRLADTYAESESLVSGQLVDSVSNSQNIRLFSRSAYESSYILKALEIMKNKFQQKQWFLIKLHLIQGFSQTLMLSFMMYTLIRLRTLGLVTIGDFALILGLSIEVGFTIWYVTEQIDNLNNAVGKCNQSIRSLFKSVGIQDQPNATPLHITKGEIIFDNVTFHYREAIPLFQNLSVTIEGGSKVGLVGYSGCGKTTFANLILRLFDINEGKILIDKQIVKVITQDSLRNAVGMIPQDPSLYHRSLTDNIRYGCLDATDEAVIEAAKRAHAHEFISKLPEGYDSLVGERGIKLSGGQRQRIAIARATLKNAPILILDEATSQLDSVTESLIQESLWEIMKGKTSLVIAHRLSTLLHMDRILVFENGKIVEDGTHHELLKKEGLYKTLWEAQVGGFLPNKPL